MNLIFKKTKLQLSKTKIKPLKSSTTLLKMTNMFLKCSLSLSLSLSLSQQKSISETQTIQITQNKLKKIIKELEAKVDKFLPKPHYIDDYYTRGCRVVADALEKTN